MAEFCLDCFNKLEGTQLTRWQVSRSWGKDLCEGCGQMKRVVMDYDRAAYSNTSPHQISRNRSRKIFPRG